ncbi:MAG TPA: FlgD immunoglobulin-like domain containing protein [bacterium]|nr:FlgD immunoglobulin-like domain containing protein [bacterium]
MRFLRYVLAVPLLLFAAPAFACSEADCEAVGPAAPGGAVGLSGCPAQPCGPTTNVWTNPPFQRVPEMAAGPLPVTIGCFAVATKDPGYYLLMDSAGPTFRRFLSRKGLTQWLDTGDIAMPFTWFDGIQCPDPHFAGTDGSMYMYLNVQPTSGYGPWSVARTESSDHGATWSEPVEVWEATATHFPYMPSVVEYQGGYRMAFSWWCTPGATLSEIHVLKSDDGLNWTPLSVPALETGGCGEWDSGSVNRPRLLADPSSSDLYMYYSGYPFDGAVPTRTYAKIGLAVSHDGGATWCESGIVLEPSQPGQGWDKKYVGKPTLVWPAASTLRLYFEATDFPGGPAGLGAAEAPWPFAPQIACPEEIDPIDPDPQNAGGPGNTFAEASGIDLPAQISSRPNPTSGATTIVIELARTMGAGQAEVTLVDVSGRVVKRLWTGSAGSVPARLQWDGRSQDGSRVAAGRYLARLRVDGETAGAHWITQLP